MENEENTCEGSGFCDDESTNDPNAIDKNSDIQNEYDKLSTLPSTGPDIVSTRRNDIDASDVVSENDIGSETTNHTNDDKGFSKQAEIKSTEKSVPVTTEKINEPENFASTIEPTKVEGSYSSTEFSEDVIRNSTMNPVVKQPAFEGIWAYTN